MKTRKNEKTKMTNVVVSGNNINVNGPKLSVYFLILASEVAFYYAANSDWIQELMDAFAGKAA